MTISLISCIDLNNSIGNKGSLLTKPPLDFKHFKSLTEGNFVVFGRNTYEEIGKPLSNRTNILLTKKTKHDYHPEINVYQNVQDILFEYENYAEKQIDMFICGGQKVYEEFMPYADFIYLTIVDHIFDKADRHFPQFSLEDWLPIEIVKNEANDTYLFDYYFVKYQRKINTK